MGKTLAVVFWSLAAAGGAAYYVQSQPVAVPISPSPVATAPVANTIELVTPDAPEPTKVSKPRTLAAFELLQAGATKTLIVIPPAPDAPYSITLFAQPIPPAVPPGWILPPGVPIAQPTQMWAGINPADKPSIYTMDTSIGNPPWVPGVRNHLPLVWAYRSHYYGTPMPDGSPRASWTVFFRASQGLAAYGGALLLENSPSPLITGQLSATAGWSFQLTD